MYGLFHVIAQGREPGPLVLVSSEARDEEIRFFTEAGKLFHMKVDVFDEVQASAGESYELTSHFGDEEEARDDD